MMADNYYDPIIVLGTGRCGSSATAGILHRIGVHMGFSFKPPDNQNVYGYYEDVTISQLNNSLIRDEITLRQWNTQMAVQFAKRRNLRVPWGWKHPMTADLLLPMLGHCISPLVVRCSRDKAATIESFVKAYAKDGCDEAKAKNFVTTRTGYMDKWLKDYNVLEIEYEDIRAEPERIVNVLCEFIGLYPAKQDILNAVGSIRTVATDPEMIVIPS